MHPNLTYQYEWQLSKQALKVCPQQEQQFFDSFQRSSTGKTNKCSPLMIIPKYATSNFSTILISLHSACTRNVTIPQVQEVGEVEEVEVGVPWELAGVVPEEAELGLFQDHFQAKPFSFINKISFP